MPKAHLTDLSVQKLPPGLYYDTKTPAFGVRVGKNRRTWIVCRGERRIKTRLGLYPDMTLAEARKRAMLTLASPMGERPTISFPDARTAFLALPRWRAGSLRVLTSSLNHFSWKKNVDKITHEDIASAIEAIPGASARAHALKDIRTFFNWLVPRYIATSPCAGLKMAPQRSRDRVLTPDELKAIWNACEGTFGTIVRLLILTGCRKLEIGRLRSDHVRANMIDLPAEVTKNGRAHSFPIGPLTQSLIPSRDGFLFRSAKDDDQPYNGFAFHLKQLQKASGTKDWSLHDLRRTYATLHAEMGTPIHVIEKALNHVSGSLSGVAGIYNRFSYLPEQQSACLAYEARIRSIVSAENIN